MLRELWTSIVATLVFSAILCGVYPAVVWGIGQVLFPRQANGSLIEKNGKLVASSLIGQTFTGPKYFNSRPSAAGNGYDATSSSGNNLGPTSKKLLDGAAQSVQDYRKLNGLADTTPIPDDAIAASGSGLDPHISIANANLQAPRIARERKLSPEKVSELINQNTDRSDFGILGDAGVNVVKLNLALDELK